MTARRSIIAVIPFLLFGCALPEIKTEEPAPAPKSSVRRPPTSDRNDEIPLRDPDVASELPDEQLTGTGAGTQTGADANTDTGTVIARPPAKAADPSNPPEKNP